MCIEQGHMPHILTNRNRLTSIYVAHTFSDCKIFMYTCKYGISVCIYIFTQHFVPMHIPLVILPCACRLIAANERVWLTEGNEFHLVEALAQLVESFTVSPQLVSSVDR